MKATEHSTIKHIVVAPDGDDTNPGTPEKPLASLSAAQQAVREQVTAGLAADLVVHLREGVYTLAETLAFGPDDSGTERFSVTYAAVPGAKVVVSGGRVVEGWEQGAGELWTAKIPDVKEVEGCFRQLWVNDRRATRARMPNADAHPSLLQLGGANLDDDMQTHAFSFGPGVLAEWRNLGDVEAVVYGVWEIMRKRFAQVSLLTGLAHMQGPHGEPSFSMGYAKGMQTWGWRGRYYLENALEFLDQPGEWYLDRQTGVLTYWPRPGEDMTRDRVIVPRLERLVAVKGTPERPVRNLHFRGIAFEHADWSPPPGGYLGIQACWYHSGSGTYCMDAAIGFEHALDCSVSDGVIAHLGGCGIAFSTGCTRLALKRNHVHDISGNGIMIGSLGAKPTDAEAPTHCRVENNHVHDCGVDYAGAVGIWVGLAQQTVIAHNLVHDLPYSGISMGWQWNSEPSAARDNVIEWNHVHHVMQRLFDGGGIYTLGFQPGTIIRHNYLHDISGGFKNNGIFLDEGSKGFRLSGNVIGRTDGSPVRFNQGHREWHEWEGNLEGNLEDDPLVSAFEVPHDDVLEPDRFTLEARINPAEIPDDGRRWWVVNKNGNERVDGHYALLLIGSRVAAFLNIGGGSDNLFSAVSRENVIAAGGWQHVALRFDGIDLRVYHNGVEVASTPVQRERTAGSQPLVIGHRADDASPGSPFRFRGFIDGVRLHDRALDAGEIAAGATNPDAPPSRPPVAAWSFEDIAASAVAAAQQRALHYQTYLQALAKAGLKT